MRVVQVAMVVTVVGACGSKAEEPPAPRPAPARVVPLAGGDTFDETRNPRCLVATLAELKKHPHWMIRIDERTSFVPNIDAPPLLAAIIERDASGAAWHDGWREIAKATTALDAAQTAAIDQALAGSCVDPDGGALTEGDIRWFEIGYGPGGEASVRLSSHADVTLALGPIFDAARARHVAERLPRARTLVLALAGHQAVGETKWKRWSMTVDLRTPSPDVPDADAVTVLDWAVAQPEHLPAGPRVVSGTLTVDGVTRPIAVSIDLPTDRDRSEWASRKVFAPLWELLGANYARYDYK